MDIRVAYTFYTASAIIGVNSKSLVKYAKSTIHLLCGSRARVWCVYTYAGSRRHQMWIGRSPAAKRFNATSGREKACNHSLHIAGLLSKAKVSKPFA